MADAKKILPFYQVVKGVKLCGQFDPSCFESALEYQARADDIFIVTYPKCGTTWTQALVQLILYNGVPAEDVVEFYDRSPFLEVTGQAGPEAMQRPGAIKCHLPFHLHPWHPEAKYIFVVRKPTDACVSLFHHTRTIPGYDYEDGKFEDFFELFMKGEVDYGDYFDWVLSWWQNRDKENILILTYEDIKADTVAAVTKLATFLGQQYAEKLKQDPQVLQDILKYSSVSYMKTQINDTLSEIFSRKLEDIPEKLRSQAGIWSVQGRANKKIDFIRKGEVNDSKNLMTSEQSDRLNKVFEERTKGIGLQELWK